MNELLMRWVAEGVLLSSDTPVLRSMIGDLYRGYSARWITGRVMEYPEPRMIEDHRLTERDARVTVVVPRDFDTNLADVLHRVTRDRALRRRL